MATQTLDTPDVVIQPTPVISDPSTGGRVAEATTSVEASKDSQQAWESVAQGTQQIMRDQSLRQAQIDGAAAVKYDAKGHVLPPTSTAIGGFAYMDTYRDTATAYYRSAALTEMQSEAQKETIRNPTDPGAVNDKLKTYQDAKLAAMPPELATQMRPALDQVRSQAMNSADAGRQREVMATVDDQAKVAEATYVASTGQLQPAAPGATQAEQQDSVKAQMERNWQDVAKLYKASGRTDEWIANRKLHADATGFAMSQTTGLMHAAAAAVNDPVKIANLRIQVDELMKNPKLAGFQSEMRPILDNAISLGAGAASAAQQADALDHENKMGRIGEANAQLQHDIMVGQANGAPIPPNVIAERQAAIYQQAADAMKGARPMQRAQLLGAGNAAQPIVMQAYSAALSDTTAKATYGTPQEQITAMADLVKLRNDPWVTRQAASSPQAAAIVANADLTLARKAAEAHVSDDASRLGLLANENISPQQRPLLLEQFRKDGALAPGRLTPEQLRAASVSGDAAYAKSAAGRTAANAAVDAWQKPAEGTAPRIPSSQQQPEVEKAAPFNMTQKAADGKTDVNIPFDLTRSDHVARVAPYVQANGFLPSGVKTALGAMSDSNVPPETQNGARQVRNILQDVYTARFAASGMHPEDVPAQVQAAVEEQLGGQKVRQKIDTFEAHGGNAPGTAIQDSVTAPSSGRNASPADTDPVNLKANMTGSLLNTRNSMKLGGIVNDLATQTIYGKSGFSEFTGLEKDQSKFRAFNDATNMAILKPMLTPQSMGQLARDDITPDNIVMGDNFRKVATPDIQDYMLRYGQGDRDSGLDPSKQGLTSFLSKNKDDLSLDYSVGADGKGRYTLNYKTFATEINKGHPGVVPFTSQEIQDFTYARFVQANPSLKGNTVPGVVYFTTNVDDGGRVTYQANGLSSVDHTSRVFLANVDPKDAAWETGRQDLAKQIGNEMKDDGATRFLSNIWGGKLFDDMIAANKRETLLGLASGRTLPGKWMTDLVTGLHDLGSEEGKARWSDMLDTAVRNNPGVSGLNQAVADRLKTDQARETIARYGSPYYILFGNAGTHGLPFGYSAEERGTLQPSATKVTPTTLPGPLPVPPDVSFPVTPRSSGMPLQPTPGMP